MNKAEVAVAYGDGIGPEIMQAVVAVLSASGARIEWHPVEVGQKAYLAGYEDGIKESSWEAIKNTRAFLKSPIMTPQGGGWKSVNVTIRTTLGLFANIRPCMSYFPFVHTKHSYMDVVIVRENEEDLYTGIEYRQSPNMCHAIKMISREGTARVVRYAFSYARRCGRRKVSCFTKDNILKLSDGLFHQTFDEIAREYPDIDHEHWIVDIGMAKLADTPQEFDVIVLPNLYGDIASDIIAQQAGSIALAGSANIGSFGAMFEAVHGSAPMLEGKHVANPSGLLLAAVYMLHYLGQCEVATRIHNAWLATLEDGVHTKDLFDEKQSSVCVGTQEFAQAIIDRLGLLPKTLPCAPLYMQRVSIDTGRKEREIFSGVLVGVDVYLYQATSVQEIMSVVKQCCATPMQLKAVFNRGVRVWPKGHVETLCSEQWRFRFSSESEIKYEDILQLLHDLTCRGCLVLKTENLYEF